MDHPLYHEVRDPVCGMRVRDYKPETTTEHGGRRYFFCAPSCREKFLANPNAYAGKKRGFFTRWLDRLARINEEEYGSKGPTCCH